MKSKTLLVIDDEKDQRDLIRTILEPYYNVLEASDCDEALALHRENLGRIHLVVVDVILPGGTGFDLCEAILEMEPHMKVLFLSGVAGAELRKFVAGADGAPFLQKPFEDAELLHHVRSLLEAAAAG